MEVFPIDTIKLYITEYLIQRLRLYSLSLETITLIVSDIENRLISLITQWNDISFRRTLLITCVEEAIFYEPDGDLEMKSLIVLTVRNSLIEDVSSTKNAARKYGLSEPILDDNDIRLFTQDAIKYFNEVNLSNLSNELRVNDNNPYRELPVQYPVAWNALSVLGNLTKQYGKFVPISKSQFDIETIHSPANPEKKYIEVLSGMDPIFTSDLQETLNLIIENKTSILFSDSFKMITRHPEKLFKIIEIVLRANAQVVTFNFFISNGYVSKRKPLLRPAHSGKDIENKLDDLNGLSKTHLEALKYVRNRFGKA